jgi:hypothetical protein
MVLYELLETNRFVWSESLSNIMVSLEHIKEVMPAFLNSLSSGFDIRVSRRIKLILNLVNF